MGQNGFLRNVSIKLIDKTDCNNPKKEITGGELSKSIRPLDLILKTVSDQPHIAKFCVIQYNLDFG